MLLPFSGCAKKKGSAAPESNASNRKISFGIDSVIGLNLANSIGAWAKEIDLVCPDKTYPISFADVANQKFEIARDLAGCTFKLKKFVADALVNLPMPQTSYDFVQDSTVANNGLAVGVFDSKNDKGELLDRRLVNYSQTVDSNNCILGSACRGTDLTVTFSYSQLTRTDTKVVNNIKITANSLKFENELPPQCTAAAEFVTPTADNAMAVDSIKLRLTLYSCVNLATSKELQFGWVRHWYSSVYQAKNVTTTEVSGSANVIGLHERINGTAPAQGTGSIPASVPGTFGSFTYTGSSVVLELTLAQLKALSGKSNTFEALREDLVLAIRNKEGKSISYFVVDNDCTTSLTQAMNYKLTSGVTRAWTQSYTDPAKQGLWTVSKLDLGTGQKTYPGFCMDVDRSSGNADFSGDVVSSFDFDRLYRDGLVEHPTAMPQVNYILNKYYGKTLGGHAYTWSEVQTAIWNLVENNPQSGNGTGPVDAASVKIMTDDALANGTAYAPQCTDDYFAAILVPKTTGQIQNQIIFAVIRPQDVLDVCSAK
ncbi:MAG: hypothetical protein WCI18_04590 [Pseudomonadota bacterium]